MLEFKDLLQVVLVGHSYGGMVITGVADQAPQRLTQLVYLDAEVPLDGQCEFDLLPTDERADYQQAATTKGQGWQIPPPVPEPLPQELDAKLRWAMSLMVPQPINTFTQPLHLANPLGAGVRPTYVLCTQGKEGQELPGYVHRAWSDPALRVDRSWHLGRLSRFRRSRCGSRPVPPPREVAVRAGHTSTSFVLDGYGHLFPESDAALRDRLDELFVPVTEQRRNTTA